MRAILRVSGVAEKPGSVARPKQCREPYFRAFVLKASSEAKAATSAAREMPSSLNL